MTTFALKDIVTLRERNYVAENLSCWNKKDVYLTYIDAFNALCLRGKTRKAKKQVYKCSICGHYHLHSKDGATNRHIKFSRSEDIKINGKKTRLCTSSKLTPVKPSNFYIISYSYGIS